MADSSILLIVDGAVLRDDAHIIDGIRSRLEAMMGRMSAIVQQVGGLMSEISDALDGLQADLNTLFNEVEELLTQPNPDIAAALQRISTMRAAVNEKVDEINASQGGSTGGAPAAGA